MTLVVRPRLGRGAAEYDRAGIHDHHVVGKVERQLDVLLDQHDREPFGLQLRDGPADLVHDLRREALGRLVHQQHARIAHQGAADRQHLLLAAGERARILRVPLLQPREQAEYAIRVHALPLDRACAATFRFSAP